jgi:hypothetical protein
MVNAAPGGAGGGGGAAGPTRLCRSAPCIHNAPLCTAMHTPGMHNHGTS